MTKSPVALAKMALRAAREAVPAYSSKFSKHDFTQHQLFAMLVLRQFYRVDYRGTVQIVEDNLTLRRVLGLKKIPHYSTLKYAHDRLLKKGLSTFCKTLFSVSPGRAA